MRLIDRAKVEHAEEYFRQHGATSTFFGRLIPAYAELISIPAGMAGMRLDHFLLYTTLGAGIWNTVLALIGYAIYTQVPAGRTTAQVAEIAKGYSHEIGDAISAWLSLSLPYLFTKAERNNNGMLYQL